MARSEDSIHREIGHAQSDLEDSLSELKDAVRHEVDPKVNAVRALHYGEDKVKSLLHRAWEELLALVKEAQLTAKHHGVWAALVEIWRTLQAATRDLLGSGRAPA